MLFFCLKSPGIEPPPGSQAGPPIEREAHLQGTLHISQKPHLSSSPVKEPSLKDLLTESLAERCPATRALLHSFVEVPGIQGPPPPTYQVALRWKGAPMERDACIRSLS
jgi:hypothetical protein